MSGREQAALTGDRLRQTNLTYNEIVHSTLDRAVETASIIGRYLPSTPLRADDMIVEGGPVPPLPTVTYWHLPQKVHRTALCSVNGANTPFTRYNLLLNRLSNRFHDRLTVCIHDTAGCQTGCTTRFDNRVEGSNRVEGTVVRGCSFNTAVKPVGLTTGCIV